LLAVFLAGGLLSAAADSSSSRLLLPPSRDGIVAVEGPVPLLFPSARRIESAMRVPVARVWVAVAVILPLATATLSPAGINYEGTYPTPLSSSSSPPQSLSKGQRRNLFIASHSVITVFCLKCP
jgi:hypothetical protein